MYDYEIDLLVNNFVDEENKDLYRAERSVQNKGVYKGEEEKKKKRGHKKKKIHKYKTIHKYKIIHKNHIHKIDHLQTSSSPLKLPLLLYLYT